MSIHATKRSGGRFGLAAAALMVAILTVTCGGTTPAASQQPSATTAASAAPTQATLPKPEKASIKIGTTSVSANAFAPQLALELGIFKKNGLDVEILPFQGTNGTTALLAGQIDVLRGSDEAAFFSQKTNQPLQIVASFYSKFLDYFVGAKDVKTAAALKGKRIGTSTFGSLSHRESLVAIQSLGLAPTDVQFVEIGNSSARSAALRAGSVGAIAADQSEANKLAAEGFNILVKLGDDKAAQALGPILLPKKFATDNPNTVLVILASLLEATQVMFTDTPKAVAALAKWEQVKPEDADAEMKVFLTSATRDMSFTRDGIVNLGEFLKLVDPTVVSVKADDTFDLKFIQRLKDMGIMKKLGVPGY